MKPIHFGMIIVPLLFILLMAFVTYTSLYRQSGSTGLNVAKMKELRHHPS